MHRQFHTPENDTGMASRLQRTIASIALLGVTFGTFSGHANAATTYVMTDGSQMIALSSDPVDLDVPEESGLVPTETDSTEQDTPDEASDISIDHLQMVSVYCDGLLTVTGVEQASVADVLASLDLTLGEHDRVSCPLDARVYDGMRIAVTRVEVQTLDETTVTPYETVVYEDASLAPGEELVLAEGQDGSVHTTTVVTYEDGAEVSRQVTCNEVFSEATARIVLRGPNREMTEQDAMLDAYEAPVPTVMEAKPAASTPAPAAQPQPAAPAAVQESAPASTGGTTESGVPYVKKMTFQATAYTCGDQVGITATGTVACVGTVAVDPNVIPLGTKMYITSVDGQYVYGYCTALDTGGLIKGNIVDLYFNTVSECWQFGRRNVNIYILG